MNVQAEETNVVIPQRSTLKSRRTMLDTKKGQQSSSSELASQKTFVSKYKPTPAVAQFYQQVEYNREFLSKLDRSIEAVYEREQYRNYLNQKQYQRVLSNAEKAKQKVLEEIEKEKKKSLQGFTDLLREINKLEMLKNGFTDVRDKLNTELLRQTKRLEDISQRNKILKSRIRNNWAVTDAKPVIQKKVSQMMPKPTVGKKKQSIASNFVTNVAVNQESNELKDSKDIGSEKSYTSSDSSRSSQDDIANNIVLKRVASTRQKTFQISQSATLPCSIKVDPKLMKQNLSLSQQKSRYEEAKPKGNQQNSDKQNSHIKKQNKFQQYLNSKWIKQSKNIEIQKFIKGSMQNSLDSSGILNDSSLLNITVDKSASLSKYNEVIEKLGKLQDNIINAQKKNSKKNKVNLINWKAKKLKAKEKLEREQYDQIILQLFITYLRKHEEGNKKTGCTNLRKIILFLEKVLRQKAEHSEQIRHILESINIQ